jgi:hypothetical protein
MTTENSNMIINNTNSLAGPALAVYQSGISGSIANFYGCNLSTTIPVLGITNPGFVGINMSSPTVALDVNGEGHFSSNLTVSRYIYTSGIRTSGDALFDCNVYIIGDTQITGTLYAAKIRLGSVYTTTVVNGLLTATLSPEAQATISHLGTVTVDNLMAPIASLGTYGNTTSVNGSLSVAQSMVVNQGVNVRGDLNVDGFLTASNVSQSTLEIIRNYVGTSTNTVNITADGNTTTVTGPLTVTSNIITDGGIHADQTISTDASISAGGNMFAGGEITTLGDITANGDVTVGGELTANLSAQSLNTIKNSIGLSNVTENGSNTYVDGDLHVSGSNLTLGGFTFNIVSSGTMQIRDGSGNVLITLNNDV